jgi:hypothetical protein
VWLWRSRFEIRPCGVIVRFVGRGEACGRRDEARVISGRVMEIGRGVVSFISNISKSNVGSYEQ